MFENNDYELPWELFLFYNFSGLVRSDQDGSEEKENNNVAKLAQRDSIPRFGHMQAGRQAGRLAAQCLKAKKY